MSPPCSTAIKNDKIKNKWHKHEAKYDDQCAKMDEEEGMRDERWASLRREDNSWTFAKCASNVRTTKCMKYTSQPQKEKPVLWDVKLNNIKIVNNSTTDKINICAITTHTYIYRNVIINIHNIKFEFYVHHSISIAYCSTHDRNNFGNIAEYTIQDKYIILWNSTHRNIIVII